MVEDIGDNFPFCMTDEDIAFFRGAGFHHVSMAEVRRFGDLGKQTIELMVGNEGYWTAHYGTFWEGPRALTCQAAFVAAELADWGGNQRRVLTDEGENFRRGFDDTGGCSCHLGCAPCSSCTHPGHPAALEETPDLWEWV